MKTIVISCILWLVWYGVGVGQLLKVIAESGEPIPAVNIKCIPLHPNLSPQLGTTNNEGVLQLPAVRPLVIQLYLDGFQEYKDTLRVVEPETKIVLREQIHVLGEQIITAQYAPVLKAKSVYSFRVIQEEYIRASGAVTLKDVLASLTGVRLQQDGAIGSTALSLQGLGGQNIKILVDGVPVIGRLDGNIDISQVNVQNLERIELIEGPMAVNYGADALGGVINLITKKNISEKPTAFLSAYYETIGQYNQDLRLGGRLGKHKLTLTTGRNFFQGWSPQANESGRTHLWKPKEQWNAGLQWEKSFGNWNVLANNNLFYETLLNRDSIRGLPYKAYGLDQQYQTLRFNNAIFVNGSIEKSRYLDFIFSHAYYGRERQTYFKDLVSLAEQLAADPSLQDTVRFQQWLARGTYTMNKTNVKFNYQLGYDATIDVGSGARIGNVSRTITDAALFASAEYRPIKRLTLRPGVRYGYNSQYRLPFIPSLHIRLDLRENLTMRLSYGRGFRAPGLKELYLFFVDANHNIRGNENLLPETSHNISTQLAYKKIFQQNLLQIELGGFYNQLHNQIQLALAKRETSLFSYVNIGQFRALGGQITAQWSRKNVKAQTTFAYIGRESSFGGQNLPILFSPEVAFNFFYTMPKVPIRWAVFYKYNGRLNGYNIDLNDKISPNFIDAFQLLDASATYSFWKERIEFTLGAKNLLNVMNVNAFQPATVHSSSASAALVAVGRTAFVVCRIKF